MRTAGKRLLTRTASRQRPRAPRPRRACGKSTARWSRRASATRSRWCFRRDCPGRARGQGDHLRRRPGGHRRSAAVGAGMPAVRPVRARRGLPGRAGGGRRGIRRPPHREPDRRLASAIDRGARRDGDSRGAPLARRDGAGDVLRGPRTRLVRPDFRQSGKTSTWKGPIRR